MKKLDWLQALRGIAALMVLLFHLAPHWERVPGLWRFVPAMQWGFSGVDVFFALSGFVVYLSAKKSVDSQNIAQFAARRSLRIFFGYWPALALLALVSTWVLEQPLPTTEKMLRSIFLTYPYVQDNWLGPAWSLTFELYFYAWIIAIVYFARTNAVRAIAWTICAVTVWNIGWVLIQPVTVAKGLMPLRFTLTGQGVEFLLGSLLAEAYHRWGSRMSAWKILGPLGVALVLMGFGVGTLSIWFDRVEILRAGTFGMVGTGLLIVALSLIQAGVKAPAWLVRIGDASFSLYLLHTIVLDVAGKYRRELSIEETPYLLAWALAVPVVVVLLSLLWFHLVEFPLMRLLDRSTRRRAVASVARVP